MVTLLKNANKSVLMMKNVYQSLHFKTQKEQIHLVAPYIRKFVQEVELIMLRIMMERHHGFGKKLQRTQVQVHQTKIPLSQIQAIAKLT